MIKVMFFYKSGDTQSRIEEEFFKTLETLFKENVTFERIEVDGNQNKVKTYGVKDVPTIIIEKDGKITDRFVGFTQELFLKRAIQRNIN